MNFSFSLFLVSLSLPFVSCEKCSEALHEAFKRDFDVGEKCDNCVILNPGTSFRGENWAGFCVRNQLFLFQDWTCRGENVSLNITEPFAVVTNELCEFVEENSDLDEKCLKMFDDDMCNGQSGSGGTKSQDKGDESDSLHLKKVSIDLEVRETISEITPITPSVKGWKKPSLIDTSTNTEGPSMGTSRIQEKTTNTFSVEITTGKTPEGTTISRTSATTRAKTTTNLEQTSTTKIMTFSTSDAPTMPNTTTVTADITFTDYYPWVGGYCEKGEYFFNDHCYFIKQYLENLDESVPIRRIDSIASCKARHPKALGLAVETEDENKFILDLLSKFHFCNFIIYTSGIRVRGLPDEWHGWNVQINKRVLTFRESNWLTSEDMFYCIDACRQAWYLSSFNKSQESDPKFLEIICERPYNPKSVELKLHKQCIELYRNSACYNPKKHINFCCEKDDTGEIWFSCPHENATKKYPTYFCVWKCTVWGNFIGDRPKCLGLNECDQIHNHVRYVAAATRYALSKCPVPYLGYSTWYCTANRTFLGTPDLSLCCKSGIMCRATDAFLNVWMGCPSDKIVKKTACPPGSVLDFALVEWDCQENGTFYGDTPDYSSCNISKIVCSKTDRFGTKWIAAAGTVVKKKCPPRFTGLCSWHCKESGKYDGPEPDCSTCKAEWMDEIADKIRNQSNHEDVMEIMENYTEKEDLTIGYGHVLNLTAECVALFKNQVSGSELVIFEKFLKSYSKILKNVAGNPNTWSNFSVPNRREYSEQILNTTQSAAFANLEFGHWAGQYNETFANSEKDGFDFFVAYNPSVGSRFPLENFSESDWHLDIKEINESNPSFAAMGLVMSYSLSSLMFPQGNKTQNLEINGPAITFVVAASRDGKIVSDPNVVVSISFKHTHRTRMPETIVIRRKLHQGERPSGVFNSTFCFYYRDSDWTTEGCSVTFTSKDRTNCTCNHLSTIGVLMSVHKYQPNWVLELVSTISSGITIISLILALLVFYFFDTVGNERVLIGKNLCFCLLIGHIMLITVLDKKFFNIPDNICMVSAILLHYSFMAAFAWMFVEGCHLYRMLVLVFDSVVEYRLIYLLVGYGMPLIVVSATQIVGWILHEQPYGEDEVCWLRTPNYVWAFLGPVIVLTSINFCILITAMKMAISSKRRTEKSNFATLMLWMKGWVSLSALLGITWLFGLAYVNYNEPLVYAFVFSNGLQGFFIFLFRCVLCEQYKTIFLKKIKSWCSNCKSKSHKRVENIKSETKVCAISGSKSLTESKDSGYEPEIDKVENHKKYLSEVKEFSKPKKKIGDKPSEDSSGVDTDINITLTPAMSEAYLRNRMIERNFSVRKSKAKWLADSNNFPELSYHDIYHPN